MNPGPVTKRNAVRWRAAMGLLALCALAAIVVGIVASIRESGHPKGRTFDAKAVERDRLDAQRMLDSGKFEQAVRLTEGLVAAQPDNADARLMHAESLLGSDRLEEAYEHAARGAQIKGDDEAHFFAGAIAEQLERWEEAEKHIGFARSNQPNSTKYSLHYGQVLLELGRLDEAMREAERLVKLEPSLPEGYVLEARAHDERGEPDRAMEALERGLENLASFNPERHTLSIYQAKLLRRGGKVDDALGLLLSLPPPPAAVRAGNGRVGKVLRGKGRSGASGRGVGGAFRIRTAQRAGRGRGVAVLPQSR